MVRGGLTMSDTHLIITIITTIIGSGGITGAIVAVLSARKYKAEAKLLEQQAESARKEAEHKMNEYIASQLKELAETHKKESEELRRQNKELSDRVNVLTAKLNLLMNWIVGDNNRYVTWLETKVHSYDPEVIFPPYKPAPGMNEDDCNFIGTTE